MNKALQIVTVVVAALFLTFWLWQPISRARPSVPIATVNSLCGEIASENERLKSELAASKAAQLAAAADGLASKQSAVAAKQAEVAAKQDLLQCKTELIAEKVKRIEALERVNKLQLDMVAALNRIRQLSNDSERGTTVQMREVPYEKETP